MAAASPTGEWTGHQVRQAFIDYFGAKDHKNIVSSAVVPHDDPTLLFTNAGMNQFKPIFLGQVPESGHQFSGLKRATNSQKCIRAGGKHNDLDDVGKDVYHHTYFEMLGTWSFGDYFKEDAITWAFELLTDIYGLDKDRLYATYFEGNAEQGLEPDLEAKQMWCKFLPEAHVIPGNMKDNFWEMGDSGPCGPCSELHFDKIGGRNAAALVNMDDPDVMEVWNLVFMQFNRKESGVLEPLPAKHVDTGMGFERLTSLLQGKRSNYDTDIFMPLFSAIQQATGFETPYGGLVGAEDTERTDMTYRVLADHVRCLSFAIADGAVPDSTGRGYVVRRILRRAVRYGAQFMNAPNGFLAKLVPALVAQMGDVFPELRESQAEITQILAREEAKFRDTLDGGRAQFTKFAEECQAQGLTVFSGEQSFMLYDTFGFPKDLTEVMAGEVGLEFDDAGFEACLEKARQVSRSASAKGGENALILDVGHTHKLQHEMAVPATDDRFKYVWEPLPDVTPLAARASSEENAFVTRINDPALVYGLITDKTNFYAEGGGQIGDVGEIQGPDGFVFDVTDCQTFAGYTLHIGKVKAGQLVVGTGAALTLVVDNDRRALVAPNHTMTHVLNHSLRAVLGDDCDQKGSVVDQAKLRFDFSSPVPLTPEQVEAAEQHVRAQIQQNLAVYTTVLPLKTAYGISSLRSVFAESYPKHVRVVSVGVPVEDMLANPSNPDWFNFSVELCGGTHVRSTSEAGEFAIVDETASAAGVRRIKALTGDAARDAIVAGKKLTAAVDAVKALPNNAAKLDRLKELERELSQVGDGAPVYVKSRVKAEIDALVPSVKKAIKKAKKTKKVTLPPTETLVKQVLDAAGDVAAAACVVASVPVGMDQKALLKAVEAVAKESGKPTLLFSTDGSPQPAKGNGKPTVVLTVIVPEGAAAVDPSAWLAAVAEPMGLVGKVAVSQKGGSVSAKSRSLDADAVQRATQFITAAQSG